MESTALRYCFYHTFSGRRRAGSGVVDFCSK